ncbi:kinase-like domain-containing protein [Podospora conica]|nr:kinase-like domain-containing protein [Schizothecium conicum]
MSPSTTIFPHVLLATTLTRTRVERSLREALQSSNRYGIDECCARICGVDALQLGPFARIFAHLLICNLEKHIFEFFDKGLDDKAFPFRLVTTKKNPGRFQTELTIHPNIPSWDQGNAGFLRDLKPSECDSFIKEQWRVFLPKFENEHQQFEEQQIMPWYKYDARELEGSSSTMDSTNTSSTGGIGGGHSDVSKVAIHDGHHAFCQQVHGGSEPETCFVAVKRLKTKKRSDFDKEVTMLRKLGGKPHTVTLLGTFYHNGAYSLMFPWAECDLCGWWGRSQDPPSMSDPALGRWVSAQCFGLITALGWIHNPGGDVLDAQDQELFGRHGDIKPENILWYNWGAWGQLVLSDFGLTELNHKLTCTNVENGKVLNTTTYAPPESILPDHRISRIIDVWALGCVYLEFATWLLRGGKGISEFQTRRITSYLDDERISNDNFWTLKMDKDSNGEYTGTRALDVKPEVIKWVEDLRRHGRANQYILDFLDIIQNDMLVIEKGNRKTASGLVGKFKALDGKCKQNQDGYCAAPVDGRPTPKSAISKLPQEVPVRHLSVQAEELISRRTATSRLLELPPFKGPSPLLSPLAS